VQVSLCDTLFGEVADVGVDPSPPSVVRALQSARCAAALQLAAWLVKSVNYIIYDDTAWVRVFYLFFSPLCKRSLLQIHVSLVHAVTPSNYYPSAAWCRCSLWALPDTCAACCTERLLSLQVHRMCWHPRTMLRPSAGVLPSVAAAAEDFPACSPFAFSFGGKALPEAAAAASSSSCSR
jgi:hypothetical protein